MAKPRLDYVFCNYSSSINFTPYILFKRDVNKVPLIHLINMIIDVCVNGLENQRNTRRQSTRVRSGTNLTKFADYWMKSM